MMTRRSFLISTALPALIPADRPPAIRALTFDVFGTVTDWRTAVIRDGTELSHKKGFQLDWPKFAERWRAGYSSEIVRVRHGEAPWSRLDVLHRRILDRLLVEFKCDSLTEQDKQWLNLVWHRLPAWPDVIPGLARLRKRYVTATLSNGDVSMLVDISRYAGLTWDCVLSGELAHHFKTDREVYLKAAELLNLKPGEILMTAAHVGDLEAARDNGLRTAYVRRPMEHDPSTPMEALPKVPFDFDVRSLTELCTRLGV